MLNNININSAGKISVMNPLNLEAKYNNTFTKYVSLQNKLYDKAGQLECEHFFMDLRDEYINKHSDLDVDI
ncbi:MAG: hypothetical protein LBB45_04395 [Methanobrevibacter sp.]|nr:hypothetical protein [Candidatus Methanovirga basalitermitum]